CQKYISSPLTF
nr:immunoglobulin light chain junction region [Macaca mulatta]MOV34759.1 immunoglobulin light chain junction region [Macaca mulatta]MOV35262.1 immunoglobulin light chain junction region [Macaca mulatta]MOV35564.1 immunoglobulin light chain junction region [Macaca mulatta]MOV74265.1 immunoglobulin light chain junction region [Macaca mulatta]